MRRRNEGPGAFAKRRYCGKSCSSRDREYPRTAISERFWAKVDKRGPHDCWNWTASLVTGYGWVGVGGRDTRKILAHRFSYEQLVGPIPDGLVIDHLCRNRACVNPAHLEPVTMIENQRRGLVNQHKHKTHCRNGHPFSPENTYYEPTRNGRKCRTCIRETAAVRREARRGTTVAD